MRMIRRQLRTAAIQLAAAAVLTAVFLCGSAVLAEEPAGDVNGDGTVDAADAALILRTGVITQTAAADVTGNGVVDEADAEAVLLYVTGQVPSFPVLRKSLETGLTGERFMDRFSYTGTVSEGNNYRSERVSVNYSLVTDKKLAVHVLDVYLRDVKSLQIGYAAGRYKTSTRKNVEDILRDYGGLFGVNGDFYTRNSKGPDISAGVWQSDRVDTSKDVCVIYDDGRMVTFDVGVTEEQIRAQGTPWLSLTFGPCLLDAEGNAKTQFHCHSSIIDRNPRTAIGYYEPGHYCLIVADGRQTGYSMGLTMEQLSAFMQQLGCTAAYNLDGGNTSVMAGPHGQISKQSGNRMCDGILYVAEP